MPASPSDAPLPPIKIFRPGTFTTSDGRKLAFAKRDLAGMVEAYNARGGRSPIVIGHPAHNAPAYGFIGSLALDGDYLLARPSKVSASFAESVRRGQYRKVSASFLMPDDPANPTPGRYFLRHVGFLGAHAPAVRGLGTVSFASASTATVETEALVLPAATGALKFGEPGAAKVDLGMRARQLMSAIPGLPFAAALQRARGEAALAGLSAQSASPGRIADAARAQQLMAADPKLSWGDAIDRARRGG